MADMFIAAFNSVGVPVNQNIVFSENWKDYFVTPIYRTYEKLRPK